MKYVLAIGLAGALAQTAWGGVTATGGNATNDIGDYRIHTFLNSGVFTVPNAMHVDALVVAGGGGGGSTIAGGGGAGGFLTNYSYALTAGVYAVTVGAGGAGAPSGAPGQRGSNGSNSLFASLTAYGGGGGGGWANLNVQGNNGGSGGGNSGISGASGVSSSTNGQGSAGGWGHNDVSGNGGGGGGGAGSVGTNWATGLAGNGGAGKACDISGTLTNYAGGGGAGARSGSSTSPGSGGMGGGGNGSVIGVGSNGVANTGGGGGGGAYASSTYYGGGAGGGGIVIIRYRFTPTVDNASGATNVTAGSAWLNGTLISTGSAPATVSVLWGPADGGTNGWTFTNTFTAYQPEGTVFTTNVTFGLSNTMYFYRYYATNSAGPSWADSSASFLPGAVTVTATTTNASESVGFPGVFTISRPDTATNGDLVVNYTLSGTATNGVDYAALGSNVTILAGYSNATVTITPILDMIPEPAESVTLTLALGPYVIGAPDHDTIWIQDSLVFTQTVVRTWTGSNNWNSATNWNPQGVPAAGDDVRIAGGSVTLTNATPVLYAFRMNAGTLTFNNWDTYVAASNVTLSTGTVTHALNTDTAVPWTPDNRVYFRCYALTMATSCTINVKSRGYGPGTSPGSTGYGPGRGPAGSGGGHGGVGGGGGPTYGVSNAPVDPGSGGSVGSGGGGSSGAGGGAVRIDAVGDVVIDGTLNASGGDGTYTWGSGGSGGSVFISAGRFMGTGTILAAGGVGFGGGGGGGRIAVSCDANQQPTAPIPLRVNCSAAGGSGSTYGTRGTLCLASLELFYPLFSQQQLTGGYELLIPNLPAWTWTNNLTATNCDILLPAGMQLTVSNDFNLGAANSVMTLTNVALTVGRDLSVTGTSSKLWMHNGTNTLRVGRHLNAYAGGTLWFSGTNAVIVGGDVNVSGGTITHGANTATTTNSAGRWVADRGVWLQCGNLTITTNGSIDAKGMGYGPSPIWGTAAYGPGGGAANWGGGGYGGAGGCSKGGPTYGASNAPVDPGSGGSQPVNQGGSSGAGGGMVRIEASGSVTIDGTINASGIDGNQQGSGGAGGSVFISAGRFMGAGTILATGGIAPGLGGGGGGGRIAVWRRTSDSWIGMPAPGNDGTNAVGGTNTSAGANSGGKGTIYWYLLPMSGTVLTLK